MTDSVSAKSVLLLPVGAILISLLASIYPQSLRGYADAIVPLLGLVMFCMGMSLQIDDFKRVLSQPGQVFVGVALQYSLMPLLAWLLANVLGLPVLLATGLILLGACPGGTASNVICYLARANVALSITLTAVSTLFAVLLTPIITLVYVDQSIAVPVVDMVKNLVVIVLIPVIAGLLLNTFAGQRIKQLHALLPLVSVLCIVFIIGVIVARNATQLNELGMLLLLAVVLHNILGLCSGFVFARLLRYDMDSCKTIAIEVGMQNSGLAIVLANQYFSAISALPGAIFSIWHNISGSLLAAYWSARKHNHRTA